MDSADYYMKKENLFILEEDQKIRLVSVSSCQTDQVSKQNWPLWNLKCSCQL